MATITLEYDKKDSSVKKLLESLIHSGLFRVKPECEYDPKFVAKIRKAEKEPSKKLNLEKYGIGI